MYTTTMLSKLDFRLDQNNHAVEFMVKMLTLFMNDAAMRCDDEEEIYFLT